MSGKTIDQKAFSAPFAFAVAASAWPPDASVDQRIRDAAAEVTDWPLARRIVARHRVTAMAQRALQRIGAPLPGEVKVALDKATFNTASTSMAYRLESQKLQTMLEGAGVPVMFVKGAALAALAFGATWFRQARDVDILIDEAHVDTVFDLLERAGYRPMHPIPEPAQRAIWLRHAKNTEFIGAANLVVEVHWRLTNNQLLLKGVGVNSPSQQVVMEQGPPLRTLCDEALIVYLCVHGAVHGWNRLKWIVDIRALLSSRSEADIDLLMRRARDLGARNAFGQALALCQRLYGDGPWTAEAGRQMRRRRIRWLLDVALAALTGGAEDGAAEPDRDPAMLDRIQASHLLLTDSAGALVRELERKLFSQDDLIETPLPAPLQFAYPLLRLPLLALRRLRRARG